MYGAWWWPAIYPVVWRPWVAHPVYVTRIVAPVRIAHPGHVWHPGFAQPVHPMPGRMPVAQTAVRQAVGQIRPLNAPAMPSPRAVSPRPQQWQQSRPQQWQQPRSSVQQPYRAVPESQRAPIVHSGPVMRPAPVMHTQVRGNSAAGGTGGWHGGGHSGGHGGGRRG